MQKLNQIRTDLNELKLAFKSPRLYIANYFEALQNQIDVEYEIFQQKLLAHKENKLDRDLEDLLKCEPSQHNSETDEETLAKARQDQELMIDRVKYAEEICFTNLKTDQYNDNLLINIALMSQQTRGAIDTVESFLNSSPNLMDEEKIREIGELIEDSLLNIQRALFLNKGILFLSQELLVQILLESYSMKWEKFYKKSFGYLIRVEDTFISKNYFKSYESKANKYLSKRFAEQDLKAHLLVSKLEFENKGELSLCLNQLKTLNFNDFHLNKLDVNLFNELRNLEHLALNNNQIEALKPTSLYMLKNLRILNLHNNKIDSLSSRVFSGLSKMTELYLSGNRLNSLDTHVFRDLENLEILHLFNNQLKELNSDVFKGLSSLKCLNLEGNSMTTVEGGFSKDLVMLRNLNLSNNELVEIGDKVFENLPSLIELDISKNLLISISSGAFKALSNLEYLYLNSNKDLSVLDSSIFKYVNNIRILNLSDCNFERLDRRIFSGFTKLEFVNLSRNNFFDLDTEFFEQIPRVKYVDLRKNHLSILESKVHLDKPVTILYDKT